MAFKNPRKCRFTWEAQPHSPTLRLFVFDSHTSPSIQCGDLKVNLNPSQSHVSISWIQQQDSQNTVTLTVPIPKVLIDPESPVGYRAFSDHIEVKLVLLLPVDHPLVASSDSVLRSSDSEDAVIADSDVATPLVMNSDIQSLSSKEEIQFYCRNCSTRLTKRPVLNFVEMPSINWQEVADNWFGACCCSFGGVSEKLVNRYARRYTCVTGMCLLSHATVTLFKDDLEGCNFPDCNDDQNNRGRKDIAGENGLYEATLDSKSDHGRIASCNNQSDLTNDFCGKLRFMVTKDEHLSETNQFDVDEDDTNSKRCVSGISENVASAPGCCVHTVHEVLDRIDEACKHTLSESSSPYQKTNTNIELMEDQRSFLNGFLGNIFMARSYNFSKDIEWIEFMCPCCSALLGAYPCSGGDAPIDGGVRLFKCYISTASAVGGWDDLFRKYTLQKMVTNQILESAKDELSFRTVVRDLRTKYPMLQIVLLNPNAWFTTGYCSGEGSTTEPISNLHLQSVIKVLFSDCSNNSEYKSRMLEDWLKKNQADEVFMFGHQIEELIKLLELGKHMLPPSYTSIEGLSLSSLQR